MFGYRGRESNETLTRKTGCRSDAKRQLNRLTSLTCRRSRTRNY
jgi:hypothetical protein